MSAVEGSTVAQEKSSLKSLKLTCNTSVGETFMMGIEMFRVCCEEFRRKTPNSMS